MTSGHTAGQGLPHRRLVGDKNGKWKCGIEFVADDISRGMCPEMRRLPDELQLQELLVGLEYWPFGEELSQNTSEP